MIPSIQWREEQCEQLQRLESLIGHPLHFVYISFTYGFPIVIVEE